MKSDAQVDTKTQKSHISTQRAMAGKKQKRLNHRSIMNCSTLTRKMLAGMIIACLSITSCSKKKEIKIANATPGDTLAIVGDETVVLERAFTPGQPNGLFDGGINIHSNGKPTRLAEVNVVCSMPDLPNWPEYDNIYGRWLEDGEQPGEKGGDTDWQLLIYFDGDKKSSSEGEVPSWASRLAQNLCRKGDFRDN